MHHIDTENTINLHNLWSSKSSSVFDRGTCHMQSCSASLCFLLLGLVRDGPVVNPLPGLSGHHSVHPRAILLFPCPPVV